MTVSSWDDYPVHQTSELVAHPATSDRNFYDRYYFNLHGSSDELFAVFGLGQYPNLGVTDAFVDVRYGERQYIVRASTELLDRASTRVGPIRVEVLEPLQASEWSSNRPNTRWPWTSPGREPCRPTRNPASTSATGTGWFSTPNDSPRPVVGLDQSASTESNIQLLRTGGPEPGIGPGGCVRSVNANLTGSKAVKLRWPACGTTSRCSLTTIPSSTCATNATTVSAS